MAEREYLLLIEVAGMPDCPTNRIEQEIHLCYIDAWMVGIFAEMKIEQEKAHSLVSAFDRRQFKGDD